MSEHIDKLVKLLDAFRIMLQHNADFMEALEKVKNFLESQGSQESNDFAAMLYKMYGTEEHCLEVNSKFQGLFPSIKEKQFELVIIWSQMFVAVSLNHKKTEQYETLRDQTLIQIQQNLENIVECVQLDQFVSGINYLAYLKGLTKTTCVSEEIQRVTIPVLKFLKTITIKDNVFGTIDKICGGILLDKVHLKAMTDRLETTVYAVI